MEEKSIKHMQEAGAEVNKIGDLTPFRDAVRPVWDKYGAQHAALIKRIIDPQDNVIPMPERRVSQVPG